MKYPEYRYTHDAMKTTFALHFRHGDKSLCDSIAQAAIQRIDEIEQSLSRYVEGSEVWQINHMKAGESLFLSDLCYSCLRQALLAYEQTGGLFDITLGTQVEHLKQEAAGTRPVLAGQLMVDPERPAIHCVEPGRELDLGGIGKGFALDQIASLIEEAEIESALVASGPSTQLAIGEHAWQINLQGDEASKPLTLEPSQALSASGTSIQGSHIISPREEAPNYAHKRVWLVHKTAAMADAFSTACLLMQVDELRLIKDHCIAIYYEDHAGLHQV